MVCGRSGIYFVVSQYSSLCTQIWVTQIQTKQIERRFGRFKEVVKTKGEINYEKREKGGGVRVEGNQLNVERLG